MIDFLSGKQNFRGERCRTDMYDDRVGLLDYVGFVLVEDDPDILVLVT